MTLAIPLSGIPRRGTVPPCGIASHSQKNLPPASPRHKNRAAATPLPAYAEEVLVRHETRSDRSPQNTA